MIDSPSRHTLDDPYHLERFARAQEPVYDQVLSELRSGRKQTHWMWYVFPQLDGLGASPTSKFYALAGVDEAKAYIEHRLLGPRLIECVKALLQIDGSSATDILGTPDDLKLHSSATLFAAISPEGSVFDELLAKYFGGRRDGRTLELLGR